jgi:nucleoid-associated protein YgaU
MGLFSFIKDAGKKLFGKEEAATIAALPQADQDAKLAEVLMRASQTLGFKVDNLNITVNQGTASISGHAASQSEKEKIVLSVGNVDGVVAVDDNLTAEIPEPEARMYTVKKGDTLWKIAAEMYDNGARYPEVFEANKPMLKDADEIFPGQVLRIP